MWTNDKFVIAAVSVLLLASTPVESGKKKKADPAPVAAQASPAAAPAPGTWEAYESGVALIQAGQMEAGAAKLEQASADLSDPIVWCYSRLHLANAYFQQGNAAEDDATRNEKFSVARERFRQASFCVGAETPTAGDPGSPTAEELAVIVAFQGFGTEDLASQLEEVSAKQGNLLTGNQDHGAVADHWRLVANVSGPTRQSHYNIALACFEGDDLECAAAEAVAGNQLSDSTEPQDPVRQIVTHALERAQVVDGAEADRYWKFVFGLVSDWHEQAPLDDQPAEILQETLAPFDRTERLRLLALSDSCWVPLQVAEGLRDQGEDFLDEAMVAHQCDPEGSAKNLLVDIYYSRAKEAWNGLTPMTAEAFHDPSKVRAHMREIEPALQNLDRVLEITDYQRAIDLKSKISDYVAQMDTQRTTLVQEETAETLAFCKQQWNSFRWWSDRRYEMLSKTPSRADFDGYRRSCAKFIDTEGIQEAVAAMGEDVDEALMLSGCQKTWEQLRERPEKSAIQDFEKSCQRYVKKYEVAEQLQQAKNRNGG